MKNFYVIGNGFDLHYGLLTSYDNFKKYLIKEKKNIVEKVDDLFYRYLNSIDKHPSWAKFESMLRVFSNLDYEEIYHEAIENAEYDMDKAAYWDSPSFNVDYYNDYIEVLKESFNDWICSIDREITNDYFFQFQDNDFILSFNYTLTLEKYFNIKSNQIVHIHGDINFGIILGHNDETEPDLMPLEPGFKDDYRFTSTREKINNVLKKASKLYFKNSKKHL